MSRNARTLHAREAGRLNTNNRRIIRLYVSHVTIKASMSRNTRTLYAREAGRMSTNNRRIMWVKRVDFIFAVILHHAGETGGA
jgi:hypothetical protein